MTNVGVFAGGLILFILGLYVLGGSNDVHSVATARGSPRMGVAGLRWVRLDAALIGAVGLFVMLVGTML